LSLLAAGFPFAGKEFFDHPAMAGSRPYGQPGQKPKMATLLPYWLGMNAHL
jgi:hypothetical protein